MALTPTSVEALVNRVRNAVDNPRIEVIGFADMQAVVTTCEERRTPKPKSNKPADVLYALQFAEPALFGGDAPKAEEKPTTAEPADGLADLNVGTAAKRALKEIGIETLDDVKVYDTSGPGISSIPGVGPVVANRIRKQLGLSTEPAEQLS